MSKINWQNVLIIVALVAAGLGMVLPQTTAPAPVASTQAFQCAPGAMCVQSGGKVVTFPSGSTLGVMSGATFTATDFTAGTITATTIVSQFANFAGAAADLTGALTADSGAFTGTVTGDGFSGTYLTGTLGTAAQPNVTSVGNLTSLSVGGGYASTGCDLTAAGDVNCAGKANVDGAVVVTGTSTFGNVMTVNANGDFDSISVAGNSDVTTINNTGANPVTINDDLAVTGTLSVTGATFTGAMKWGAESDYASGTNITHGFATTPTVCGLIGSSAPISGTTVYISATTTFSVSFDDDVTPIIYWACGQ